MESKKSLSLPSTSKAMILCAANGISLLRVALFFPGKPDFMIDETLLSYDVLLSQLRRPLTRSFLLSYDVPSAIGHDVPLV